MKFSKIVWPGDTVVCKGRVTERWGEEGRYFAELDLWAENQKGELVLRGGAQMQLFHSLEDENRQRSGQPPLVDPGAQGEHPPARPSAPAPRKEPAVAAPVTGVKKATPRESPALREGPRGDEEGREEVGLSTPCRACRRGASFRIDSGISRTHASPTSR